MDQKDTLRHLVAACEDLGLDYFITGSIASSLYGEPRMTHDIDVVIRFRDGQLPPFLAAFAEARFRVDELAAERAVRDHSFFNIDDEDAETKIDVIAFPLELYNRNRLERAERHSVLPNQEASVAAPEDVILSKLRFYREGGSEKHLRDCTSVVRVQLDNLDFEYLEEWADLLDVLPLWRQIVQRVRDIDGDAGLPAK